MRRLCAAVARRRALARLDRWRADQDERLRRMLDGPKR